MKRDDLIELLKTLPENVEIYKLSGDECLGDYSYTEFIDIMPHNGFKDKKGNIWTSYSNYMRTDDKPITVWVIE